MSGVFSLALRRAMNPEFVLAITERNARWTYAKPRCDAERDQRFPSPHGEKILGGSELPSSNVRNHGRHGAALPHCKLIERSQVSRRGATLAESAISASFAPLRETFSMGPKILAQREDLDRWLYGQRTESVSDRRTKRAVADSGSPTIGLLVCLRVVPRVAVATVVFHVEPQSGGRVKAGEGASLAPGSRALLLVYSPEGTTPSSGRFVRPLTRGSGSKRGRPSGAEVISGGLVSWGGRSVRPRL